jgi:hypothetical protein
MYVESKFNLQRLYGRQSLLFVVLLFAVILVFSCFTAVFNGVSPFVSDASDKIVNNETELKNAVNDAAESTRIVLNSDIILTDSLVISANKTITLTSKSNVKFFKLLGADNTSTIFVDSDSVLKLGGIIVTHVEGAVGCGVIVERDGTLMLYSGEISGNIGGGYGFFGFGYSNGGGVYVGDGGCFVMSGGKIWGNFANHGGGVFNGVGSTFTLERGVISGNEAINCGGGVYNEWDGNFIMLGGEISGNTADQYNDIYLTMIAKLTTIT